MTDNKQIDQNHLSTQDEALKTKEMFTTGTSFAGIGLVLLLIGNLFSHVPGNLSYLGKGFFVIGLAALFVGCYRMAKGKGYHAAWSLLGFLSLIGFIILYFLPTRIKEQETTGINPTSYDGKAANPLK